jgi:glycosyltransferase involved in cell wall biosynthesis
MRIGVYNRHWATLGGGERYAGGIAQALSAEHQVDLLSPTPVSPAVLEERLRLDLSATRTRLLPADLGLFKEATREYDVLVNCSFMSFDVSGARRSIYVVLFPGGRGGALRTLGRGMAGLVAPHLMRSDYGLQWGSGFYAAEGPPWNRFRWTTRQATVHVALPRRERVRARLTFLGYRPATFPAAEVTVEMEGRALGHARVGNTGVPVALDVDLVGRGMFEPMTLLIRSDTFVPGKGAVADTRELGVALRSVQLGHGPRAWLLARYPLPAKRHALADFLDSYQEIVSISEFTRRWVRRRWGRDSRIVYPPVARVGGSCAKERIVLSVGRFFDRRYGHSKKQVELVEAFRALVARGLSGWELHLVGACAREHENYLARVRRAADGLPVRFHIDAPSETVVDLYRRASIFWHGTGLGESERRHPERFEHFGISTVEAMGAGAIPIVVGHGGQAEIVQHGINGFHVRTVGQFAKRTEELARRPALCRELSEAARRRAESFSEDLFTRRVRALIGAGPDRPPA